MDGTCVLWYVLAYSANVSKVNIARFNYKKHADVEIALLQRWPPGLWLVNCNPPQCHRSNNYIFYVNTMSSVLSSFSFNIVWFIQSLISETHNSIRAWPSRQSLLEWSIDIYNCASFLLSLPDITFSITFDINVKFDTWRFFSSRYRYLNQYSLKVVERGRFKWFRK